MVIKTYFNISINFIRAEEVLFVLLAYQCNSETRRKKVIIWSRYSLIYSLSNAKAIGLQIIPSFLKMLA